MRLFQTLVNRLSIPDVHVAFLVDPKGYPVKCRSPGSGPVLHVSVVSDVLHVYLGHPVAGPCSLHDIQFVYSMWLRRQSLFSYMFRCGICDFCPHQAGLVECCTSPTGHRDVHCLWFFLPNLVSLIQKKWSLLIQSNPFAVVSSFGIRYQDAVKDHK